MACEASRERTRVRTSSFAYSSRVSSHDFPKWRASRRLSLSYWSGLLPSAETTSSPGLFQFFYGKDLRRRLHRKELSMKEFERIIYSSPILLELQSEPNLFCSFGAKLHQAPQSPPKLIQNGFFGEMSAGSFTRQRLVIDRALKRVSMGWWLLRLSAKILALLRLSVNFFQLRLTKFNN